MRHIRKLVRGYVQLLRENLSVPRRLIQHIDIVGVFEDVLYLFGSEEVLHVLRDTCRNTAPLSESLPNLHHIRRCLFLFQQEMALVYVVSCGFVLVSVYGDTVPNCVLND